MVAEVSKSRSSRASRGVASLKARARKVGKAARVAKASRCSVSRGPAVSAATVVTAAPAKVRSEIVSPQASMTTIWSLRAFPTRWSRPLTVAS